ncbi:Shedu immune nuclease family protein [Actinokineospora spheciospongiae]|uniref:Shedu immune nuclease family protein n=1 Tax=Actinokineospora spheciospongiae TaxID=909613 RepID=UPI000D712143|nr:Shedu immune nuclease family protein [Actinokineospora spheciospongiae]PWW53661.1 uncharacterized protein DUF4263 [Actinokineospora spheciospongiae]
MAEFSINFIAFETEFLVENADFSVLEIRDGGKGNGFKYFYNTETRSLVTDFVLADSQRVSTLCQVTIIEKEGKLTPRIRLWKRDKSKSGKVAVEHVAPLDGTTKMIKATVDTDSAHENFWKVIHYLQSVSDLSFPKSGFRVVESDEAELLKSFQGKDKETILDAVRITLGSSLTEADLHLLGNRKSQLDIFERLLADGQFFESEKKRLSARGPEAVWQHFFETNPWIFGYGLSLISCQPLDDEKLEQITAGANIFTGAGKRADAVLRSRGYISSLAFCEIKTHASPLLKRSAYRPPDVYQPSDDVVGGIAQVQKTVNKAIQLVTRSLHDIYEDDGTPTGVSVSTIRPRQILVIGHLNQFKTQAGINPEQLSSFELFRTSIRDVEVVTFDELYERACFIVAN